MNPTSQTYSRSTSTQQNTFLHVLRTLNLPNKLTLLRFILTFVFIALLSYQHAITYTLGLLIFIAATITDYYDGKIARKYHLETNFGKLMDPVADKVLISAAFIMLMLMREDLRIPGWSIVIVIGREFLITGARSLAASEGVVIGANRWGKTKAIFQMIYVYVFLGLVVIKTLITDLKIAIPIQWLSLIIREGSFWGAVAIAAYTVYSGYQFARINWHILRLGDPS